MYLCQINVVIRRATTCYVKSLFDYLNAEKLGHSNMI